MNLIRFNNLLILNIKFVIVGIGTWQCFNITSIHDLDVGGGVGEIFILPFLMTIFFGMVFFSLSKYFPF
jgi:hypothetical protein